MIEIALSLKGLGPRVSFVVLVSRVVDGVRVDLERLPPGAPISLEIPTSAYAATNWHA